MGLAVQKASVAVASVAHAHAAHVLSSGTLGPRPADIAQRPRTRPATAPRRVCGSAAGPGGDGLSRDRHHTGDACGGVAPALMPNLGIGAQPPAGRRGQGPGGGAPGLARPSLAPPGQRRRAVPGAAHGTRRSVTARPTHGAATPSCGGMTYARLLAKDQWVAASPSWRGSPVSASASRIVYVYFSTSLPGFGTPFIAL